MQHRTGLDRPLCGLWVLIADDEFLIAVTLEETLRDAGADIVSASTLSAALDRANREALSAALLDVRLGRDTTETVADVLARRAVPFVFYTGQSLPESIRKKHPNAPVLIKPVRQEAFVDAIYRIVPR